MNVDTNTQKAVSIRRRFALVVLGLGLLAAACGGSGSNDAPSAALDPPKLPAIALQTFDGGPPVTLDSFLGKPLVVNFWAAWCPSCVAEMSAAFAPVQEQLGDSVTFVGVNIQDDRERAIRLLEETGVEWISVENQDGSLWSELGGLAMPFTVFIAPDGEIVDSHNGPLSEQLLLDRIEEKLLG